MSFALFMVPKVQARGILLHFLLTALISAAFAADVFAAEKTPVTKPEATTQLFSDPQVRLFKIEISPAGLMSLRGSPRTYVSGTVTEGGRVLTNIGVHLKGMGSFRSLDEKPSLVVKFNQFVAGQDYSGLTRILLNNSVQDPTYMAELLATGLFLDAGLPAARVTHARVQLNGRDLGLYVLIEGMNKPFLKRHFRNISGNLYEGYLQDIDSNLEQDGGTNKDRADLRALLQACRISDPSQRFERVSRILDVDRFTSFAAMEMLTGHWDGYIIHTNNYRLYHDPASDRMVFITHGLDWAFRRPNMSIQPSPKSIVGRAVLQTSEGQALYRERIGTLFTNVFRLSTVTNRMEQTLMKLRNAGLTLVELARVEKSASIMRERIVLRAQCVADQLAGIPPRLLNFDTDGFASLQGWRSEFDRGEPIMEQPAFDGRRTLHTTAGGGRSRASWRTQVYLARGRYRFHGMVRTVGLREGSVALRVSGDTRALRMGDGDGWRPLSHEFEVTENGADIEFICEFYGTAGEAWFDLGTLKVRRL